MHCRNCQGLEGLNGKWGKRNQKQMKMEKMAKIDNLVMGFYYDVYKLLTFHTKDGKQIVDDIKRGVDWIMEGLEDDLKEIQERLKSNPPPKSKSKPEPRPKPKLRRRKKKPILLSDFGGNKEIGFYRKRKKK